MSKKILLLLCACGTVVFFTSCEDKDARAQIAESQAKISTISSDILRLSNEVEELRRENAQLKRRLDLMVEYLKKKETASAAKTQPVQDNKSTNRTTTEKQKSKP